VDLTLPRLPVGFGQFVNLVVEGFHLPLPL
jgi:hypothetical protein